MHARAPTHAHALSAAVERASGLLAALLEAAATIGRRNEVESAPPTEARAPTELVRRSPLQAALELLPAMTRAERHCLLVKLLAMDLPPVSPETRLLDTKECMQKILRERPLAAWGEALAPFVAAALADAGPPSHLSTSFSRRQWSLP